MPIRVSSRRGLKPQRWLVRSVLCWCFSAPSWLETSASIIWAHSHSSMLSIGSSIPRLVNTFSDSLLSRDFEGRIVVTVEPFNWREIIKVLLDAGGIVKAVDEGENALRRFLPGAEPADGVYQLLLED